MVDSVQKYKAKHSFKHAAVFAANSSLRGVKRRGNPLVKAAIVAAFAGLTTFCAPAEATENYVPTLDRTDIEELESYSSSYTMTTTDVTSGAGIYNIPDYDPVTHTLTNHYYQFAEKTGIHKEEEKYKNGNNLPNTDVSGYWYNFNKTITSSGESGVAFSNTGTLHDVIGDYIGNKASSTSQFDAFGKGTALYNSGIINDLYGDFISNTINGNTVSNFGTGIYNSGTINSITGNFLYNTSINRGSTGIGVYNEGYIKSINANFIGDYCESSLWGANGSAITSRLNGKVDYISGNFLRNHNVGTKDIVGIILNSNNSKIGTLDGNFIENIVETTLTSSSYYAGGGGISNAPSTAQVTNIYGQFVRNKVKGYNAYGGAIYNEGNITNISAYFDGNNVEGRNTQGGAIRNTGTITNLAGTFISNHADSTTNSALGGAIYNSGTITNGITDSTFTSNSANQGGALYNTKSGLQIKNSNFVNNTATSQGGAIYTTQNISIIANNGTTTFQGNTANSLSNAIYVSSDSRKVTFSLNNGSVYMYDKINGSSGYDVAINGNDKTQDKFYMYNDIQNADVTTSKVTLDMQDSSHEGHSYSLLSFNPTNTDAKIDINFANNTADKITTTNKSDGTIIIDDFLISGTTPTTIADGYKLRILTNNNSTSSLKLELSNAAKAQLENEYLVGDKNITKTDVADANEIWDKELYEYSDYSNYDTLGLVKTGNTYDSIGKIHIEGGTKTLIDTLNSSNKLIGVRTFATTNAEKVYDVLSNLDNSGEGMMYVTGATDGTNVSTIKGHNFKLFTITDETILNVSDVKIQDGLTTGNGGAINNAGIVNLNNVTFADNTAGGEANDIHNTGVVNVKTGTTTINGGITGTGVINIKDNGSLVVSDDSNGITQNSLTITSGSVKANAGKLSVAGGISNADTLEFTGGTNKNIVSGTGATVISGDVTNNASITQDNLTISTTGALNTKLSDLAISTNTIKNDGILNLTNEEEIALDITKDTTGTGKIAINTTSTKISGTISDNTIELNHGTLTFANPETNIANADLTINGCMLNLIDNSVSPLTMGTLTLNNDVELAVDVDLKNETMDRLNASTYVLNDHKINVVGMNILTDATKNNTKILFADNDIKDSVVNHVSEIGKGVSNLYQTSAYSPLYKYNVTYSSQSDGGYYNFQTDGFNPAVVATPVASQANVMAVSNIVNNYAFAFVDNAVRNTKLSSRYNNRYAVQETIPTDLNTNNPLFVRPEEESVWVKPFVTFENIPLRNGPKLNAINYGTIIGYDSDPIYLKHGWDGVITGYVGYTGSSMHYSGVDDISNGGLLGATFSLFKGNFFNATTLTAGAMLDQMTTMYGKDNVTSLYAGIGNKTGYNFDFKEGLFTIQPSLLMSYTFANTFDFTNAAGVRINTDPINVIQLSPGLKFFMNTKNGWQPYIGVNMMWNIMGNTHVKANGVQLPSMSVKPYVQYGIGIQKVMKKHFTGYAQAMMQNGGRNGISLTMGFKWAIGSLRDNKTRVEHKEPTKTVIKDTKRQTVKESSTKNKAKKALNTQGQKHVLKSL